MPHAIANDGVKLYYEESGSGQPVIFVHEFAGDHRSWEPQLRFFARGYRAIAYSARGYPPSDVPSEVKQYSQAQARDDIAAVLDHLHIDAAHVVGLSMGGFATLHFGITLPGRAKSLVIAGCGYGAAPGEQDKFRAECETAAQLFDSQGMTEAARRYATGPTRVQFQNKDPRGWQEFAEHLTQHSAVGAALTLRGVQMGRPSLWQLVEDMRRIAVPALIVTGDEDEPCLEASLLMKRTIATAGLVVLPRSGHTINLEEPDAFNRALLEFFAAVEQGRWAPRDPRSLGGGILGFKP
jgi:pimeloyl-ACP methyl ester carboxylesterase